MQSLITLICALIFFSCAHPKTHSGDAAPFVVGHFPVHRIVLSNGLKILVIEDRNSPTFSYQTWFSVGSKNELQGKTGLAHLFEHMMFKKTKTTENGYFDRTLQEVGGIGINAFTSNDYTAYIQELPSNALKLVVQLEADRMQNLVVDQDALKTETEVVQNERRFREENSPDGTLYNALFALAYRDHPYRWPVIGYKNDLEQMSASDARSFYQTHYQPNNASVVIVGDITVSDVLGAANEYYGSIVPFHQDDKKNSPFPHENHPKEPQKRTMALDIKTERLMIAFPAPPIHHRDTPALEMLETLLLSGEGSRFNRALIETGIASAVEGGNLGLQDRGLFLISVDLQKGRSATLAEDIITREIQRLATNGPSDEELRRAKNLYRFSLYSSLTTNSGKARFLGRAETLLGDFRKYQNIINQTLQIDSHEIQRTASNYLKTQSRAVIIGVPK